MSEELGKHVGAARTVRRCLWFVFCGCCAVIGLTVLARFCSGEHVWDDAYMFVRYADNVLSDGRIAWNPGGEATYGPTSLLSLIVFVPIRFLTPSNPALTVVLQSCLCGVVFLALLAVLVLKYADASRLGRGFLLVLAFFSLALAIPHMHWHFTSGMDTMFALAYLSAYILVSKWHERAPSVGRALCVGLWGGLAYFARPDLMLYSAAVPISMLIFGPGMRRRWLAFLSGAVSLLVLGAQMGFARLYFGSAFPLSFYAKTLNVYCDYMRRFYHLVPFRQLAVFVFVFWFLFVLAAAGILVRLKKDRRNLSAVDCALLASTLLFIAYYLGWAVQIMGYAARLYYPTLPALVFLAAQGAAALVRAGAPSIGDGVQRAPRSLCWFAALLVLYALMPQARTALQTLRDMRKQGQFGRFSIEADYADFYRGYWFRLDQFSALPDDLVLATTEVGLPAVMNPRKQIICLTGLNEAAFARAGFSAERLLREYQPDLIYMPHASFKTISVKIRAHPRFRQCYELFSCERLTASSGIRVEMAVALRKDSKYYSAMRSILSEAGRNSRQTAARARSGSRPDPPGPHRAREAAGQL